MINTFTKEIDESNKNIMHNFPNRNNITNNNTKEDAPLRLCNRLFQTDFIKKSKHPTPKTNPYQSSFQHIINSQSSLLTSNEIKQNQTEYVNDKEHYLFKEKEINYTEPFEIKKQETLENNEKYINDNYYTFGKTDSVSQRNNVSHHNTETNERIINYSDNLQEVLKVSSNSININDYSFQQHNNFHEHKDSCTRTSGSTFHTANNSNTKSNHNNKIVSSYSQSQSFLYSIQHPHNSLSQQTFENNVNHHNISEPNEDNNNNEHFNTESANETEEIEDIEESEEQNESINSIKVIEIDNQDVVPITNINKDNYLMNKEHTPISTPQEQRTCLTNNNTNTHSHKHNIVPSLSTHSLSQTNITSSTSQFVISREATITTPSKAKLPPPLQITKLNIELKDSNINNNFKFRSNKCLSTSSSSKQYNAINTEIVDSFITYHKFKSKNGILTNLKQQKETELKLLKEKSAFISKQKEENIKRKQQQTQLLTLHNNKNNNRPLIKGSVESRISKLITNDYSNINNNKRNCNVYNNTNNIKRKKSYKSIFEDNDTLDIRPLIMKKSLLKQLEQITTNDNYKHEYKPPKEFYNIEKYGTLFSNKSKDKLTTTNTISNPNQDEQYQQSPNLLISEFKGGCIMPVNSIDKIIKANTFLNNLPYQPN